MSQTFKDNIERLKFELKLEHSSNDLTLLAGLSSRKEVFDLQGYLTDEGFLNWVDPEQTILALILVKKLKPDQTPLTDPVSNETILTEKDYDQRAVIKEEDPQVESDTETETDEEDHDLKGRVKEALDLQLRFVREELPKRQFRGIDQLQREVVDRLNQITEKL